MADTNETNRRLACERCGVSFGGNASGAPGSCWCSQEAFSLPQPLPQEFAQLGDCVCPDCLREVAAELAGRGLGPGEAWRRRRGRRGGSDA